MGVDYYLVNDESMERYALGRGRWFDCGRTLDVGELKGLAEEIALDYGSGTADARRFANELVKWANERPGDVRIVSDHDEDYEKVQDYETTGDVYERREITQDDIRRRVEKTADALRDEFGADDVQIFMRTEDTSLLDDSDERHIWEYVAVSGYSSQSSGFKLIRVPTKTRDELETKE